MKQGAKEYLRLLSGRRHSVLTAFCVKHNGLVNLKLVRTVLKMRVLTENEIGAYIDSREWVGCAGAYSIQVAPNVFFHSYLGVIQMSLACRCQAS